MGLSTAQYQRSGSLGDVRDAPTFNVLPRIPGCNDGRVGTRGCLPMQLELGALKPQCDFVGVVIRLYASKGLLSPRGTQAIDRG